MVLLLPSEESGSSGRGRSAVGVVTDSILSQRSWIEGRGLELVAVGTVVTRTRTSAGTGFEGGRSAPVAEDGWMAVVSWDKCCGDVSFQTSTHERQAGAPRRACVSPKSMSRSECAIEISFRT